ncbi:MAG TPA: FliA/WhiG family RNA polymerase sigma factor [Limnobacter sp.]|uniref:sigma-70 family RNA polymerase sigma factor n=1 Tax=Limnobacter sp. TaxID=2003368 RepID=UPI002ED97DB4
MMTFDALEKAALLERHMPEVQRIAAQIRSKLTANVELDDLVQVGMIGLMDALQRYTHGESSFEAYAHFRIRGAIMDDLREKDHLPRAVRQMRKQVERQRQQLAHQLGREPSEMECAAALNLPLVEYRSWLNDFEQTQWVSLEDMADDTQGVQQVMDRLTEQQDTLEDTLAQRESREELLNLIDGLSDREQLVLRLYFEQEMTFKEIGSLMGVNESRAYQMHNQALTILKGMAAQRLAG